MKWKLTCLPIALFLGVTVLNDGSILVADDVSNTVWKVTHTNEKITKR